MKVGASPFGEMLPDTSPIPEADAKTVLGHLVIARDQKVISEAEFLEFGQMLGVLEGGTS